MKSSQIIWIVCVVLLIGYIAFYSGYDGILPAPVTKTGIW